LFKIRSGFYDLSNINKKRSKFFMIPSIIAIDGPAASGKTTIALKIADKLEYMFFDTGVMYRAVAFAVLDNGINIEDEEACTKLSETIRIDVLPPSKEDGRTNDVSVDGKDCTWEIRNSAVSQNVSQVSTYLGVREALTKQQRRIGLQGRVIMVGRDIGTVVLPDADLKIYLDASAEERTKRRVLEREARGELVDYNETLRNIIRRDKIDSERKISPLRAADDAIIVDSDNKTIDEVVKEIMSLIYGNK
jgi:cytidylate kinase